MNWAIVIPAGIGIAVLLSIALVAIDVSGQISRQEEDGDCCGRVLIAHAGAHCAVATSLQYARENPEAVRVWMPLPKLPKEVEECLKYAQ